VIYALEQNGQYKGTLTGADLQIDSPYNTYRYAGLPPGPIGNPGEESLGAAVNPTKTQFLYFVANTQGGHFFAASLEEHNRNVTKYRQLLKNPAGANAPAAHGGAPDNGAPAGPITPSPSGAAHRGIGRGASR
jgi:UPF0755 protein